MSERIANQINGRKMTADEINEKMWEAREKELRAELRKAGDYIYKLAKTNEDYIAANHYRKF